jgi:hypothetical protein
MKSVLSRVHLHSHKEPKGRAYIVGDRKGLLALSKTLEKAAKGLLGLESIRLFSSDGHEYELMIVADVKEEEWQFMSVPYDPDSNPNSLESIKVYESVRKQLITNS